LIILACIGDNNDLIEDYFIKFLTNAINTINNMHKVIPKIISALDLPILFEIFACAIITTVPEIPKEINVKKKIFGEPSFKTDGYFDIVNSILLIAMTINNNI
jgi:hypothetical protein